MNYGDSAFDAYSSLYISGRYVTEGQAYTSTSNAVWALMYQNGVKNDSDVTEDTLTEHLLDAANSSDYTILTAAPSSTSVSLTGDKTFTYSDEDGKWHTGALTLSAPSGYYTPFNLSLPAGVSEESGKTQIRAGESFSLVVSDPPENITISLSASIPWVDGSLLVYKPVGNAAASDGKGYQNMVGVKIRQTEVLATANITRAGKNIDVDITKVWSDNANQDGLRPTAAEYASMVHLMKGGEEVTDVKAQVTDNGDNTYTVQFINLPKYESGTSNEITYWVTEDSIPGYTADKTSVSDGGTLTNTHVPTAPVKTASDGNVTAGNASSGNVSSGNAFSGNASSGNVSSGNASSDNVSSTESALGDLYGSKTAGNGIVGSAPATGDDSNPLLYASLLAASGATLLILLRKRGLRKRGLR